MKYTIKPQQPQELPDYLKEAINDYKNGANPAGISIDEAFGAPKEFKQPQERFFLPTWFIWLCCLGLIVFAWYGVYWEIYWLVGRFMR